MNDAKCFSLGERQFLELAFSRIGFRLAVRRARQLIVRMYRAGGPLAQAIISARRAHELHCANREEEKKKTVPRRYETWRLAPKKVGTPYHERHPIRNSISLAAQSRSG